jgi:hypothetical protein
MCNIGYPSEAPDIRVQVASQDLTISKSYREFGVAPATCKDFQSTLDIRSYHGNIPRELTDRNQKIPKQDEQAVEFCQESSQGPAEEDEEDTSGKSGSSLELLRAGEKDNGLLDTNDESQADEEEDLVLLVAFLYIGACGVHFPLQVYQMQH